MNHRQPVLLMLLATTLGASWLVAMPASAVGAPTTCQGKAVTIVANNTVTQGTEGDDVVAMEPDGWRQFEALGGNDTICLAAGEGIPNNRDPVPPSGFVDAGPGDDLVVSLMTPDSTSAMTAVLGTGNDTFRGADLGETVYAEKHITAFDQPVADPELAGAQRDVIDGAASVFSSAPSDGLNADSITFGTKGGSAVIGGAAGPGFLLDVSRGATAFLEVPQPSSLRPGAANGPGEVLIDNAAQTVSFDGVPTLSWIGIFQGFRFGDQGLTTPQPTVSFQGTSVDEYVTVAGVPAGDFALGAGDDGVSVESWDDKYIPRSADGGPGADEVVIDTACVDLVVRLGARTTCDGVTSSGPVIDFNEAYADSGTHVVLIGTDLSERLVANANRATIVARGGADEILVDDSHAARVAAGRGRDRVWASGDDVIIRGQKGRDHLTLGGTSQISSASGAPHPQQVALGGPGPDKLYGTTDDPSDRLIGGPGKDLADGRAGRRDLCRAEVTRRCERR